MARKSWQWPNEKVSLDTKRRERIEFLKKLKGGKCEVCGYARCADALDFHHINPAKKRFNVSESMTRSLYELLEEITECALLCANCHREAESMKRAWKPLIGKKEQHGSP